MFMFSVLDSVERDIDTDQPISDFLWTSSVMPTSVDGILAGYCISESKNSGL